MKLNDLILILLAFFLGLVYYVKKELKKDGEITLTPIQQDYAKKNKIEKEEDCCCS